MLLGVSLCADGHVGETVSAGPKHFIFFGQDRHRIRELSFLQTQAIAGAQIKYTWKELEPEKDRYAFQPIRDDLTFLKEHGKQLVMQLQDVSFSERILVPHYLVEDPTYSGGAARQYTYEGDEESKAVFDGWVARRWDPAVRARFARLLQALGREFDGQLAGLTLPETAVGFGESGKLHPPGFTYEGYRDAIREILTVARAAFSHSFVIQYANFMPGEWLPWEDHGYLKAIYAHAEQLGVGVGGPDLLPYRRGQLNHSYPLIAARGPRVPAGVAVQDGNLAQINPETSEKVTPAELHRFAQDPLRLDYVFWGTEEPYYSQEILPFLKGRD